MARVIVVIFGGGALTETDSTPSENPDSDADLETDAHRLSSHRESRPQIQKIALRFLGLGSELATYTLVLAGCGYWIDSARQHAKPYATAIGTLIGFTFGMIRVIQVARKNAED
jgi:F0F1-type ATP synthase assembly protein I